MIVRFKNVEDFERMVIENGHTQSSLSQQIGMDRSYIHVVTKRNQISAPGAKKICDALGVSFSDIFLTTKSTKEDNERESA